jgi:hypothetical protein
MIMARVFTQITYRYTDTGGSKYRGSFCVEGTVTHGDLQPYLFDTEFFVPEQVGLDHLLTDPWSKQDHLLHTLEDFETMSEASPICSAQEIIERFKIAAERGWFDGYT